MSDKTQKGGDAFPMHSSEGHIYPGMSLLDYFAGQALAGLSVGLHGNLGGAFSAYAKGPHNEALVERAYSIAEAMVAKSEERQAVEAEA